MSMKTRKRYNKTPQRRKVPGIGAQTDRGNRTPIGIISSTADTAELTVVFDQPVVLKGLPGWVGAGSETVIAAEMTDPVTCVMTFSAPVTAPVAIPFEDPGIRNNVGGYVRVSEVTF